MSNYSAERNLRYALVVGHGRSGTNMVLDLLDRHELTFCRNEPNEIAGSVMEDLPQGFFESDLPNNFTTLWRQALKAASHRQGARDLFDVAHKTYFRRNPLTPAVLNILGTVRGRRILSYLDGRFRSQEWLVPEVLLANDRFACSLPVFKILLMGGWVTKTHNEDPGQFIIHVLRDPSGFLQSWWNRYVLKRPEGPEFVFGQSIRDIDRILAYFGAPTGQYRSYSKEAVIEVEAWRWRYVNETLIGRLHISPRYHLVHYWEVKANPVTTAQELYPELGLSFTRNHETRIGTQQQALFTNPHREELPAILLSDIVERVVGESQYRDILLKHHI